MTDSSAVPVEFTEDLSALYRLFDAADVLLYVGITKNLRGRMRDHAAEKPWWPDVARKTLTWYDTWQEADLAETAAILAEKPLHNIAKTGRSKPAKAPREPREPNLAAQSDPAMMAAIGAIARACEAAAGLCDQNPDPEAAYEWALLLQEEIAQQRGLMAQCRGRQMERIRLAGQYSLTELGTKYSMSKNRVFQVIKTGKQGDEQPEVLSQAS